VTRRARILSAAATVAVATGAAVALAAGGSDDPPAPAHPRASTSPLVSLGQPLAHPRPVPGTGASVELRWRAPQGHAERLVVAGRFRDRRGRQIVCDDGVFAGRDVAKVLRRSGATRAFGECVRVDDLARSGVSLSSGTGSEGPTWISGLAAPDVRRLVLSGPGGTYDVPRSPHGAFRITYSRRARGPVTLAAHRGDGRVVYHRIRLPLRLGWSEQPHRALSDDPTGLPRWSAAGYTIDRGALRGRTCVVVQQDTDDHARERARMGDWFGRDTCGDLRAHPLIATAYRTNDPRTVNPDMPPVVARRRARLRNDSLVVAGAVSPLVRTLTIEGAGAPRPVRPGDGAVRAFVAVLPPGTRPEQLTLVAVLRTGRTLHYPGRPRVNGRLRDQ
jgi:hypothetical protein